MNRSTLLAVLGFAGAGAIYYVMANRDTTPVGLTSIKKYDSGTLDGTDVSFDVVDGTFRESESALPIYSTEDKSILVLYQDGEIVDAFLISPADYLPMTPTGDTEDDIRRLKNWKTVADSYGGSESIENFITSLENDIETPVMDNAQTQNAESMMLGHIGLNALQSNHCW